MPEPDKVAAGEADLLSHSFLNYLLQLKHGSTILERLIRGKEVGKTVLTCINAHLIVNVFFIFEYHTFSKLLRVA